MGDLDDTNETTVGGTADGLDPRDAASLISRTKRQVERGLDFRATWLSIVAATVVLVGFGVVWLSVRSQHPFTGPSTGSLVVLYALVAIRIATVVIARRRAHEGVTGRSVRLGRAEGAVVVVALLTTYVLMVALARDGNRHASFYWVDGVTATLIVLGAAWGMRSAVRAAWRDLAVSIAVMLVGAGGALAGPRAMWLVDGIGLCVVILADAAARSRFAVVGGRG